VERTIARARREQKSSNRRLWHQPARERAWSIRVSEEESKIEPAIKVYRARGWNVEGPLPADTLFFRARRGDFDIVIPMCHDQGHGPVKVLAIESGVNIMIGLPIIRTSIDHSTGFDIADTGKADQRSPLVAIEKAIRIRLARGFWKLDSEFWILTSLVEPLIPLPMKYRCARMRKARPRR
jgi:hypothetical protein